MGMAFVTMWIRVWVPWMRAHLQRSGRGVRMRMQRHSEGDCDCEGNQAMLWAFVEEAANRTTTTMEFVTQTKKSWTSLYWVPGPHGMRN